MSPADSTSAQPDTSHHHESVSTGALPHGPSRFWLLFVGCIGVVYGDIGTSPLYAFREAVSAAGGTQEVIQRDDALGVLSLILWALTIIVTLKYVVLLLRADNQGEGGTLSLMALAQRAMGRSTRTIFLLGVCGAALFFGDAIDFGPVGG